MRTKTKQASNNKPAVRMLIAAVSGIAAVVGMLFTGSAAAEAPADSSINTENAQYWREVLQHYRTDAKVNQIMLVRYTGGCSAKVFFYEKLTAENDAWSLVFEEDDAFVGKFGIGKTSEGDAKTPIADLGVLYAFGIRRNPGTALRYIDVKPTTFACDEECEYYNTILDTAETGHNCKGEEMYRYTPEYNYGIATDFNAECVPGAGSAIFLHCKGAKAFTGGCVALDEQHMSQILRCADAGMRVVIGND